MGRRKPRRKPKPKTDIPPSPTKLAHRLLLDYDQIPTWHQDNEYIRSGYRPESKSTYLCFASWAYIHNETANIFTHLIPAVLSMISILSTATVIILLNPKLQGLRYRTLRVCTFVFTGLSGFAPLVHGIQLFGVKQMNRQSGMPFYLLEGLLLIIGALFYATRIPESIKPGKFDIWGCSHQIFHVLVVAATAVHAYGIWEAFDYNYHRRSCGG
ncbi:MAG: hypothetical protein Q9166_002544 [cf. Caloplaca sp. 2 TL-2023]